MTRKSNGGQSMTALLLIGMLATASAGQIRSPSFFRRSLLADPPAPAPTQSLTYRATDSPATFSGLQDAASSGTTTVTVGHYLTNLGLMASTSWAAGSQTGGQKSHSDTTHTGTWGQEISYSAVNVGGDTRTDIFEDTTSLNGITIDSVKLHQANNLWVVDSNQGNVYKLDTSSSGSGTSSVLGVFQTSPGRRPHTSTASCAVVCAVQMLGPSAPACADLRSAAVQVALPTPLSWPSTPTATPGWRTSTLWAPPWAPW